MRRRDADQRRGRVFVGRAPDRSEEGVDSTWWQMPQGGLDEGEEPEAGARRELAEETGVTSARFVARTQDWLAYDLPDELIGIAWEGRYRGQKQLWFAARFEGPESEIDLGAARGARAGVRRLAVGDARRAAGARRAVQAESLSQRDRAARRGCALGRPLQIERGLHLAQMVELGLGAVASMSSRHRPRPPRHP